MQHYVVTVLCYILSVRIKHFASRQHNYSIRARFIFIKLILSLIDKIHGMISQPNINVVIYRPYFRLMSHYRIARGLGQLPRSYRSIFDAPIKNTEHIIIRSEIKDFCPLNNFEK